MLVDLNLTDGLCEASFHGQNSIPAPTANQDLNPVVFFSQAEDGIRDWSVTGVQTCALPICRAFGFFAWYRPLIVHPVLGSEEPVVSVLEQAPWSVALAGTCTALQFRRMEMRRIGTFAIDPTKREEALPGLATGARQAIGDISIANRMDVRPRSSKITSVREPYGRTIHLSDLRGS